MQEKVDTFLVAWVMLLIVWAVIGLQLAGQ
jgi:hypothetical protein